MSKVKSMNKKKFQSIYSHFQSSNKITFKIRFKFKYRMMQFLVKQIK